MSVSTFMPTSTLKRGSGCSIIVDRLRREFKVDCDVGAPQVNYRESISRKADIRYVHKKQSGGSGQFADIALRFEPGEPGTGFEFRSEIKGGVVPKVPPMISICLPTSPPYAAALPSPPPGESRRGCPQTHKHQG